MASAPLMTDFDELRYTFDCHSGCRSAPSKWMLCDSSAGELGKHELEKSNGEGESLVIWSGYLIFKNTYLLGN